MDWHLLLEFIFKYILLVRIASSNVSIGQSIEC